MRLTLLATAGLLAACAVPLRAQQVEPAAIEPVRSYIVARAAGPITVDGRIDAEWDAAPWSESFIDIEGTARPRPPHDTRMRMLWDDEFLYVAARLDQPHVWGTLTERDAVIFHDDDFELFIDPDGDTHHYYELEINALGTVWDLLLTKPYRDGGRAIDAWDIRGLKAAVHVDGTINDPADTDRGWSVELALPWSVLAEAAPEGRRPRPGEQWRVNFSRVDWDVDVRDGRYVKRLDPATRRPLPEHNRVWSPQGAINMHMPERWGIVQFAAGASVVGEQVAVDPDAEVTKTLRALYYAQRRHHEAHGRYADDLAALGAPHAAGVTMIRTQAGYEISARASGGRTLHVREDGRLWKSGGEAR